MIQKHQENRADSKKLIQMFEKNESICLMNEETLDLDFKY